MKKKTKILLTLLILLLLIPIPNGTLKDGGTKAFTSLTYKIVSWNRLIDADGIYSATEFYVFPYNFLSLDRLWSRKPDRVNSEKINEPENDSCSADHSLAKKPQTISDPYENGWCGNTQASITIDGKTYGFMLGDAITLNALYRNQRFKDKVCKCEADILITTEFGEFSYNSEKGFIRNEKGQCQLTEEQIKEIEAIIERQT